MDKYTELDYIYNGLKGTLKDYVYNNVDVRQGLWDDTVVKSHTKEDLFQNTNTFYALLVKHSGWNYSYAITNNFDDQYIQYTDIENNNLVYKQIKNEKFKLTYFLDIGSVIYEFYWVEENETKRCPFHSGSKVSYCSEILINFIKENDDKNKYDFKEVDKYLQKIYILETLI